MNYKGLESTEAARARLGIGRTKFYELLDSRAFKSVKIGRRRLVVSESLDAFIDSLAAA
jgi:excisionase family DNA binding protein